MLANFGEKILSNDTNDERFFPQLTYQRSDDASYLVRRVYPRSTQLRKTSNRSVCDNFLLHC